MIGKYRLRRQYKAILSVKTSFGTQKGLENTDEIHQIMVLVSKRKEDLWERYRNYRI